MKFLAKKEDIFNGIRLVANVAAMKSLQPVLANILIETVDDNAVKTTAYSDINLKKWRDYEHVKTDTLWEFPKSLVKSKYVPAA